MTYKAKTYTADFNPDGTIKHNNEIYSSPSALSIYLKRLDIPVCDQLKSPNVPIWILHGRDHFTFCFQTKYSKTEEDDVGEDTVMTNVAATEGENKEDGLKLVQ